MRREESLNKRLRSILKRADIELTSKELQEEIRNFNQYQMRLGVRVHDIIYAPGDFIKYLKRRQEVVAK